MHNSTCVQQSLKSMHMYWYSARIMHACVAKSKRYSPEQESCTCAGTEQESCTCTEQEACICKVGNKNHAHVDFSICELYITIIMIM